ncbi:hypothetical protein [Clostridium felsineum]|uniref:hypothetical protein n=1 Tax=Clostridium felsineum TaxID=36839 RepID=UPI00098CB4E3|nr:hypothetical protein [Clostridium felsineum]URZ18502.1 hypothetical protein CLFE_045900 [Clostridium felsineum DSM 794]
MKKAKFIIPATILLFSAISIVSYMHVNNASKINIKIKNTTSHIAKSKIKNINMDADVSGPIYNDIDTIIKNSDIIVQGTVLNASYFDEGFRTYTKTKIKVLKSYNKNINNGDILTFFELGGITTQQKAIAQLRKIKPEIKENNDTTPIKRSIYNIDTMTKKQQVMLFAKAINSNNEKAYIPLGFFEGRFFINKDKTIERPENNIAGIIDIKFTQNEIDQKLNTLK